MIKDALKGMLIGLSILALAFACGFSFIAGSVTFLKIKSDVPLCISVIANPPQ